MDITGEKEMAAGTDLSIHSDYRRLRPRSYGFQLEHGDARRHRLRDIHAHERQHILLLTAQHHQRHRDRRGGLRRRHLGLGRRVVPLAATEEAGQGRARVA